MMIDVTCKNVILSGPMTGLPNYNIAAFMDAHAELRKLGAGDIFNPALSWMQQGCVEKSHGEWLRASLHELTTRAYAGTGNRYDVLALLPGWQESNGACMEVSVADAIGIQMVELSELLEDAHESQ
jgi:hypothetical protein